MNVTHCFTDDVENTAVEYSSFADLHGYVLRKLLVYVGPGERHVPPIVLFRCLVKGFQYLRLIIAVAWKKNQLIKYIGDFAVVPVCQISLEKTATFGRELAAKVVNKVSRNCTHFSFARNALITYNAQNLYTIFWYNNFRTHSCRIY